MTRHVSGHALITQAHLQEIMQGAGDLVLSYFRRDVVWHEKEQRSIVTEADIASERYLIEKLTALMPAAVIAEESGISDGGVQSGYRWVIDPLDGTTNFAAGIPYFCVSVALTYQDQPVIGAVYQPVLREFFYASYGGGAWLNGQRVYVSQPSTLADAVIVHAFPYKSSHSLEEMAADVVAVGSKVRSIRQLGAVALDVAYVAAGIIDGTFFEGTAWWDVAAGMLLLREAGGVCSEYTKTPIGPQYATFCGGSKPVYEQLLILLSKNRTKH